jgi:uncharacterized membrane protein
MSGGLWSVDKLNLAAILAAALATYACRGGGYWLFRQIQPTPLIRAVLTYIPGTLFISFVVPAVMRGGMQAMAGTVATLIAMIYSRNMALAVAVGVAAAWAVWALG